MDIRVAIIEDDDGDFLNLNSLLNRFQKEVGMKLLVSHFYDGESFLFARKKQTFEITFFDIDMKGLNGIEVAKRFRKIDNDAVIIFTTNLAQYAIDGYSVNALDFMLKPLSYPIFKDKIGEAIKLVEKKFGSFLTLKVGGSYEIIKIKDIKYIETQGHKTLLHEVSSNRAINLPLNKIEKVLEEMGDNSFAKSTNGILINLAYVTHVGKQDVEIDGESIPVSRRRRNILISLLNRYLMGGNIDL